MRLQLLITAFIVIAAQLTIVSAQYHYPETKQQPVIDDYFGVKIKDNYRWLENMNDTSVQKWFKAQTSYTDNVLRNIEGRDALLNDMIAISNVKASVV